MSNAITLQPDGGNAIPAVVVVGQMPQGNVAIPVYLYATYPTDRPVEGGAPRPIIQVTDADMSWNGGQYQLEGRPYAMPMFLNNNSTPQGGAPLVVYVVN